MIVFSYRVSSFGLLLKVMAFLRGEDEGFCCCLETCTIFFLVFLAGVSGLDLMGSYLSPFSE